MGRGIVAAVCAITLCAGPARADLVTPGTTALVSPPGVAGESSYGVVSGNGRVVVFESVVDISPSGDGKASRQVYLRDLTTGASEAISVGEDGALHPGGSGGAATSRDGRFVAFSSSARLTAADTNVTTDVYIRDRALGVTTLASPGDPARGSAGRAAIADDGATVAFEATSEETPFGISVWRRVIGAATPLVESGWRPSITADGRRVAFFSPSALVPEDLDGEWDVYITDVATGVHTLVTGDIDVAAFTPDISADGRRIAYMTLPLLQLHPVDLHVRDLMTGETKTVTSQAEPYDAPAITRSGDHVTYAGTALVSVSTSPGAPQPPGVYVWDWRTGETSIASTSSMGTSEFSGGSSPTISDDGRFIAFDTRDRLAEGDDDIAHDVYLRDRAGPCAVTCLP